jgi:hypothetical protein
MMFEDTENYCQYDILIKWLTDYVKKQWDGGLNK